MYVSLYYYLTNIGLSNILDSELQRRKPSKWPHGYFVCAAIVDSQLFVKVLKGIEGMAAVEMFLVLSVAAIYFAVVPGRVCPNQLMRNPKPCSYRFEQGREMPLGV